MTLDTPDYAKVPPSSPPPQQWNNSPYHNPSYQDPAYQNPSTQNPTYQQTTVVSPQVDPSVPLAHGVLYSTKLKMNKKFLIIYGMMFLIMFFAYFVPFVVIGTIYGYYYFFFIAIVFTLFFLCFFGFAFIMNSPKRAEIYSDHLKVCIFVIFNNFVMIYSNAIIFIGLHFIYV